MPVWVRSVLAIIAGYAVIFSLTAVTIAAVFLVNPGAFSRFSVLLAMLALGIVFGVGGGYVADGEPGWAK